MSDIDTEVMDNLKVLDPRRPIREATGLMRHSKTTRSAISGHSASQQIFLSSSLTKARPHVA